MTYSESAKGIWISFDRAMQELDRHGIMHDEDRAIFFDEVKQDARGLFKASDVLEWLGY